MLPEPHYRARLLVLADHLRTRRGHEVFDFGMVARRFEGSAAELVIAEAFPAEALAPCPLKCGSAGCAIGEMPWCWPRDCEFTTDKYQNMYVVPVGLTIDADNIRSTRCSSFETAQAWFGLSCFEADHLFCAGDQQPGRWGGFVLEDTVAPSEVARNIEEFVSKQSETLGALDPAVVEQEMRRAHQDQAEVLGRPSPVTQSTN